MHVVAFQPAPLAVDAAGIPPSFIDGEKEDLHRRWPTGKPQAIVEKILVGQLDKFYAGIVLNEQAWVKDDAMTVKAVLDGVSKAAGGPVSVQRVALFQVGA